MRTRFPAILTLFVCLSATLFGQVTGPLVRFQTSAGDIEVMLLPDVAPQTVANFLKYVNRGSYSNSIIHRSVRGFVIQGGGYQWVNRQPVEIPSDGPVQNEFNVSNTRGTIAMAKLGDDPNSATTQWFFNLANNSGNLNNQNGGFTVFGRITNSAGLLTMDRIANVPVFNAGSPFDQLPLVNFTGGEIQDRHVVMIRSIVQVDSGGPAPGPAPSIRAGGVATAGGFGGSATAAPGTFIEIYGTNLAGEASREWTTNDFNNGTAPTTLDDVSVTIGGRSAYISYISAGQINAQVPADAPTGDSVPVVVRFKGQDSAAANIAIKPINGGMLAPSSFNVGGKQYVVAARADGSFASNGSIPGTSTAPAKPGETLTMYGVGFGPVLPSSFPYAGQVAADVAPVAAQVEVKIGDSVAPLQYAGLAPTLVGLYQFNITVPANAPSGDLPVSVLVSGETIPQTLFISVQ